MKISFPFQKTDDYIRYTNFFSAAATSIIFRINQEFMELLK